MARTKTKPLSPVDTPEVLPAVVERIHAAQDGALAEPEREALMDLGRRLGQMEAATFLGNISDGILLSAYENVKKSKAWRNLVGKDGKSFPNLEAFCQERLGFSKRRLNQIIENRGVLGQEAFEQAERIGLRQVDYNAIKSLPAPEQELVRRAVEETKSRDEVIDLIQELASRNATEREALTKQIEGVKKDQAATEKRLGVVTKQKEAAEERAALIAVASPDEVLAEMLKEASEILAEAQGMVRGRLRAALIALHNQGEDNSTHMAGLVGQLQADLVTLRDEFNLADVVGDGTPAWQAWVAQQDAGAKPN